eukprot:TRINITY_DN19254_c0_g1_i1.p1 TRINITY_DN19254_c0_g1~~TRINITY_DN19254_c0_g1_i1.p1  ORF type:complete len:397 (-),score=22.66 TRINITY_DN19254_c0_g1_i1:677-1867(-)
MFRTNRFNSIHVQFIHGHPHQKKRLFPKVCYTTRAEITTGARNFVVELDIVALRGTVPMQWVEDARKIIASNGKLTVNERTTYLDIYKELQKSDSRAAGADIVSMGDQWLQLASENQLIREFDEDVINYVAGNIINNDLWTKVAKQGRNKVLGIPYRWGCVFFAVNSQRLQKALGRPIQDWNDLLNPKLRRKLALPTTPQMLVSIAAKTLDLGFNPEVQVLQRYKQELTERVQQLINQALLIDDRDGVRSILCGDAWVVLGSSDDLISVADRGKQLELVAPKSGTILWCDLWSLPYSVEVPNPLTYTWINFGLQPDRVVQRKGIRRGGSPLLLTETYLNEQFQDSLQPQKDQGLYLSRSKGYIPQKSVLDQSEFLMPLNEAQHKIYNDILEVASTT